MMSHASEMVSINVYTYNVQIITDCLDELEPFIDSIKPKMDEKNKVKIIDNNVLEMDGFIENLLNRSEND